MVTCDLRIDGGSSVASVKCPFSCSSFSTPLELL